MNNNINNNDDQPDRDVFTNHTTYANNAKITNGCDRQLCEEPVLANNYEDNNNNDLPSLLVFRPARSVEGNNSQAPAMMQTEEYESDARPYRHPRCHSALDNNNNSNNNNNRPNGANSSRQSNDECTRTNSTNHLDTVDMCDDSGRSLPKSSALAKQMSLFTRSFVDEAASDKATSSTAINNNTINNITNNNTKNLSSAGGGAISPNDVTTTQNHEGESSAEIIARHEKNRARLFSFVDDHEDQQQDSTAADIDDNRETAAELLDLPDGYELPLIEQSLLRAAFVSSVAPNPGQFQLQSATIVISRISKNLALLHSGAELFTTKSCQAEEVKFQVSSRRQSNASVKNASVLSLASPNTSTKDTNNQIKRYYAASLSSPKNGNRTPQRVDNNTVRKDDTNNDTGATTNQRRHQQGLVEWTNLFKYASVVIAKSSFSLVAAPLRTTRFTLFTKSERRLQPRFSNNNSNNNNNNINAAPLATRAHLTEVKDEKNGSVDHRHPLRDLLQAHSICFFHHHLQDMNDTTTPAVVLLSTLIHRHDVNSLSSFASLSPKNKVSCNNNVQNSATQNKSNDDDESDARHDQDEDINNNSNNSRSSGTSTVSSSKSKSKSPHQNLSYSVSNSSSLPTTNNNGIPRFLLQTINHDPLKPNPTPGFLQIGVDIKMPSSASLSSSHDGHRARSTEGDFGEQHVRRNEETEKKTGSRHFSGVYGNIDHVGVTTTNDGNSNDAGTDRTSDDYHDPSLLTDGSLNGLFVTPPQRRPHQLLANNSPRSGDMTSGVSIGENSIISNGNIATSSGRQQQHQHQIITIFHGQHPGAMNDGSVTLTRFDSAASIATLTKFGAAPDDNNNSQSIGAESTYSQRVSALSFTPERFPTCDDNNNNNNNNNDASGFSGHSFVPCFPVANATFSNNQCQQHFTSNDTSTHHHHHHHRHHLSILSSDNQPNHHDGMKRRVSFAAEVPDDSVLGQRRNDYGAASSASSRDNNVIGIICVPGLPLRLLPSVDYMRRLQHRHLQSLALSAIKQSIMLQQQQHRTSTSPATEGSPGFGSINFFGSSISTTSQNLATFLPRLASSLNYKKSFNNGSANCGNNSTSQIDNSFKDQDENYGTETGYALAKFNNACLLQPDDKNLTNLLALGSPSMVSTFLDASPSIFDDTLRCSRYAGKFKPLYKLGAGNFGTAYLVVYEEPKSENAGNGDKKTSNSGRIKRTGSSPAPATPKNSKLPLRKLQREQHKQHIDAFALRSAKNTKSQRLAFPTHVNDNDHQAVAPSSQPPSQPPLLPLPPPPGPAGCVSGMASTAPVMIATISDKVRRTNRETQIPRQDVFVCKVEALPTREAKLQVKLHDRCKHRPRWDNDCAPDTIESLKKEEDECEEEIYNNQTENCPASSYFRHKLHVATRAANKNLDRMQNEAHILANIAHPNIVGFIDFFIDEKASKQYLFLEYVDGGDLFKELQRRANPPPTMPSALSTQATTAAAALALRGRMLMQATTSHPKPQKPQKRFLSEQSVLHIFVQIVLAVEYLHRHNILHRDIKSQNILLSKHSFAKLTDFGTSRQFTMDVDQNVDDALKGTPLYLSPEQYANAPYSQKCEMWSLGVLLYELLSCGEYPFFANNMNQLGVKVCNEAPTPLPRQQPCSNDILRLLSCLLNKDPHRRPTAKQVLTHFPCMVAACNFYIRRTEQFARSPLATGADQMWLAVIKEHVALVQKDNKSSQKSRLESSLARGAESRHRSVLDVSAAGSLALTMSRVGNSAAQQNFVFEDEDEDEDEDV